MLWEKTLSRDNNFHFIRFTAATLVILSHTYPLYGSKFEPYVWLSGYETFGGLAVCMFFVISGFLITKSWLDSHGIISYFKKRFLRLFPGLFAAMLFCVLVVGPLTTTLDLNKYFLHSGIHTYIYNVFLFPIRYSLPGVFVNNPYPNAVNGSIWSLPVEAVAYFIVALLGVMRILSRRILVVFLTVFLIAVDWYMINRPEYKSLVVFYMLVVPSLKCIIYFLMGAIFYLYREKVHLDWKLLLLALLFFVGSFRSSYGHTISYFTLPYLVLYSVYADVSVLRNFGRYGDFSYGIYVYAFPVQQTLMYYAGSYLNKTTFFLSAFVVTLLLGIMSWHFIEKPALGLKNVVILKPNMTSIKWLKAWKYPA